MKDDFISEIPKTKENEWLFHSTLDEVSENKMQKIKKYIGKTDKLQLLHGKVYEVLSVKKGWYQIIDETGEDYLYPPEFFVDVDKDGYIENTPSDYIKSHLQ